MWSKFFRIPVLLLFIVLSYYGCVEEPTIEPVKRPYTMLRLANFSYNVDTINVSIDNGKQVFNLYKNQAPTQYFSIESGKRKFFVTSPSGDTLYNDKITVGSYEELSLYFTGYSKPHDEFYNTFGYAQFTAGAVYLYEGIGKDSSWIQLANFAPDTPTDSSKKYYVLVTDTTTKKVVKKITSLAYNSFSGIAMPSQPYKISYAKLTSAANAAVPTYDFYGDTTYTFESGYEYFVYGIGNAKKPTFVIEKISPLAIMSK